LYGINIETGGPIISNVTVTGNTISGADVRLRGGGQTDAGCNIGYVTISGNTIDGMRAEGGSAFGQNVGIDKVNVCRDITISGNSLLNAGFAPVSYTAVDGLSIVNNVVTHTQAAALAYEIAVSTVNTSRRVSILNNLMHDTAQTWREGYGMLRRTGATSTETPKMFGNVITTGSSNVSYSLATPYMSINDGTAAAPAGLPMIQVGGIMIRDNAGVLEKSTNSTAPNNGTWTAV
jgi:hypothetical protein